MSFRRLALILPICLAACQTGSVEHMESATDVQSISSEEYRLWHAAGEFDEKLVRGHYLYEDAELNRYVQSVMDNLYPEYTGVIRIGIINSPDLNAFALPNGSIYINTGMLSRLENEAQMATVLAHEGVHFVNKHSFQQRRSLKQTSAFSLGIGMITGIPALGSILTISSIYGYSKDLEREADKEGFRRLEKAGYDVSQSPITFQYLLTDVETLDIKQPYFFSSHPRLEERIESFSNLAAKAGSQTGRSYEAEFQAETSNLKLELLNDYLEIGQYKSVLLILKEESARKRYPPQANYYLGEAYRLRDEEGDVKKSVDAYLASIGAVADFSPPYRAMGIHYMKHNESDKAISYFTKYLELSPHASDIGYIKNYISKSQSMRGK